MWRIIFCIGCFLIIFLIWFAARAYSQLGSDLMCTQWPLALVKDSLLSLLPLLLGLLQALVPWKAPNLTWPEYLQRVVPEILQNIMHFSQVIPQIPWGIWGSALSIFLWRFVGGESLVADCLCFAFACLISGFLWQISGKKGRKRVWIGVMVLSFWLSLSSFDFWISPCVFSALKPSGVPLAQRQEKETRIGLALSGGGYRAALMHAGVLSMLDTLGVRVTHLSTVSGGSIIGAYYAIGGKPDTFVSAVQAQRFNVKRRLLNAWTLPRLIFPARVPGTDVTLFPKDWGFSRTDIQATMLNQLLFQEKQLADDPQLMICTTDLLSGSAVGLTASGLFYHPLPRSWEREEFMKRQQWADSMSAVSFSSGPPTQSLAHIVAASGAFPVAFAPVSYTQAHCTRQKISKLLKSNV